MDTRAVATEHRLHETRPSISQKILNDSYHVIDADDFTEPTPPADSLGPNTPDSNRENGDCINGFASPLTWACSPFKPDCSFNGSCSSSTENGPHTPKEGIFDPFAPGPDKFLLAPLRKKYADDPMSSIARQLKFEDSASIARENAETSSEEDLLLETIYGTLLEAIVSKQREGHLVDMPTGLLNVYENQTPTSVPGLKRIADTCPGAPKKPTREFRDIHKGLCRRLQF